MWVNTYTSLESSRQLSHPSCISGANIQQPGLNLEGPDPSLDSQEIPLQSPRDIQDWASQVSLAVHVTPLSSVCRQSPLMASAIGKVTCREQG